MKRRRLKIFSTTVPFRLFAIFSAAFFLFNVGLIRAQNENFQQTGQIRAVVSETVTELSNPKNSFNAELFPAFENARAKTDFYFAYTAFENGTPIEKWQSLPADRVWSALSNQTVRLSGTLQYDKLTNFSVNPLSQQTKNFMLNPPPTVGLYKTVVVPLTIQPASSVKSLNKISSTVTPEAVRHNFFNAPDAVNKFYLEASYGKFGFTGVHHPQIDVVPVTIQAVISSQCQDQIINEFTPIVRQRLREQNIDTASGGDVDIGIIIYNDIPGCPPYPFATRGALGQRGVPFWLWMPESWFVTGRAILAHEIGHTLGGNHPARMRCADFNDLQTCVSGEADDRDLMTYGGKYYLMPNNFERRRWGWHPPGAFERPFNDSAQIYNLHSPVLPFIKDGQRQGRFFFRNLSGIWGGWDIYPESRRNSGLFEKYQAADESFHQGIAVRIGHSNFADPDALSILLDAKNTDQIEDAPLRANQQISIGGTTIKSVGEQSAQRGFRMNVQP